MEGCSRRNVKHGTFNKNCFLDFTGNEINITTAVYGKSEYDASSPEVGISNHQSDTQHAKEAFAS